MTKVYFATNRTQNLVEEVDDLHDGDLRIRFGTATVESIADSFVTERIRKVQRVVPVSEFGIGEPIDTKSSNVLKAWFKDAEKDGAIPLFLIHGFACGFRFALHRAAQLVDWYRGAGLTIAPLLFSWPACNMELGPPTGFAKLVRPYREDQAAAEASGIVLGRLLHEVLLARIGMPSAERLSLLAHSMGCFTLQHGLDAFTRQLGTVADQCHASRPANPAVPVRTPGEKGLAMATGQKQNGVALYPAIMPMLEPWAEKLGVVLPLALT